MYMNNKQIIQIQLSPIEIEQRELWERYIRLVIEIVDESKKREKEENFIKKHELQENTFVLNQ